MTRRWEVMFCGGPSSVTAVLAGLGRRCIASDGEGGALHEAALLYAAPADTDTFGPLAAAARRAGAAIAVDLDRTTPRAIARCAALADIVLCSEPAFIAGGGALPGPASLRRMLALGPEIVVVTLGEAGVAAAAGPRYLQMPWRDAAPGGAGGGDLFRAMFLDAWLDGVELADALRRCGAADPAGPARRR